VSTRRAPWHGAVMMLLPTTPVSKGSTAGRGNRVRVVPESTVKEQGPLAQVGVAVDDVHVQTI